MRSTAARWKWKGIVLGTVVALEIVYIAITELL